jgi:signal transduction histidine kinase
MQATQTLARRLIRTMTPWFLLIAVGMTAAQIAVQYVSVNADLNRDLASLGRTVEPAVASAVWELDQPTLDGLARGIMLNMIVTGVSVVTEAGATLVVEGEVPSPRDFPSRWFSLSKIQVVQLQYRNQRRDRSLAGRLEILSGPQVVWQRIRSSLFMTLLSSLVITGGLWLTFFGTIRRQLSKTVSGLAGIVAGWRTHPDGGPVERIEYPYRDELGALVDALNHNRARLAVSMQDLNAINQNLEKIVAARTFELREAKDSAESADRLKSAFLATMSHELRTPLNSIIGFTGILMQELGGPLNQEQKKQMGMVRHSAGHLLELINDVLDLSKIEAGQLQVDHEATDLMAVAAKVVQMVQPLVQKKGLELRCELPERLEPVISDRRRVEQILMNLLSNAIKFTETGAIQVRMASVDATIRIQVTDTGIGIAPEDLNRLFRPFSQIDTGLSRKYVGTGLGLSICKRLTELLGGRISVESVLGRGSTFTVLLPRAEASP